MVEGAVPDLGRFPDSDQTSIQKADFEDVTLVDVSRLDREAQRVNSEQMCIRQTGVSVVKFATVYAYSDQLDAMANDAGLLLRARHRGWRGKTWRGEEDPFVAIYERADRLANGCRSALNNAR